MKIIVVSHERSGTHLTLNSLHEDRCVNVPTSSKEAVNDFLLNYNGDRIVKSHHQSDWFDEFVFKKYKIIYVQRNLFDTLNSMYFYCKKHPKIFGDFTNMTDFVWSTPNPQMDVYSFKKSSTFVDRIINHRLSFKNSIITKVNYETIVNDYDNFKVQMNLLNIPVRGRKPKMGEGQYVSPRKGIVGDYKNNMSPQLISDITNYIKKEYGYDTVE